MAAEVATPLARYAPFRRAGDLVIFAGIVAADPTRGIVIKGYTDLPADLRKSRQRNRRDVGRYQRRSDCRSILVHPGESASNRGGGGRHVVGRR